MTERCARMRRMYYQEGLSMSEIGEHFGVTRQRVHQIIGSAGGEAHYGQAKKDGRVNRLESAYSRILAGNSVREEAEKLGMRTESLKTALKKHGTPLPAHVAPEHGTHYRYAHGCRCDECKQAEREERRKRKERGPKIHGTTSAYINYACRCDECKKAGSINNRERRIRRIKRLKERMPVE